MGEETDQEFVSEYDFEIRKVIPKPLDTYHPIKVAKTAAKIRRHVSNADLVHSFIAYPYLPAAAAALLGTDTPLTGTALGTYAVNPLSSLKTRHTLRFGYRRSARIFCISDYTKRRIEDGAGVSNASVLPLGVDLDQFDGANVGDDGYVLSVGAIKERKGQDVLIEAFADVAGDFPDTDLYVVGPVHSDGYKRRLDEIVTQNGLEDRVSFLGEVRDRDRIADLYRNCTLFALTPRVVDDNFEGFGLVYLEAGAYGKPSVATESGGVPTAVRDGETGLLAPEDDVAGIAEALRRELNDPSVREEYGENAREYARSLSWERYTEKIIESFESIASS